MFYHDRQKLTGQRSYLIKFLLPSVMNLKIPMWWLFASLIVIAVMIFLWPSPSEPINTKPWHDAIAKKDSLITIRERRIAELIDSLKLLDSVKKSTDKVYEQNIRRLKIKQAQIKTDKASKAELDSIIQTLYP